MIAITWNQSLDTYDIKLQGINKPAFDIALSIIKMIPALSRSYDEFTKTWHISENYLKAVETGLKAIGIIYTLSPKLTAPSPFMQSGFLTETDKHILTFFKLLPYEVASKAFKLGMVSLHPDRGGSQDNAARLSEAWVFLEKTFFQK